jgi:hypothetical protein
MEQEEFLGATGDMSDLWSPGQTAAGTGPLESPEESLLWSVGKQVQTM